MDLYSVAAQVIPTLMIALAIEARSFGRTFWEAPIGRVSVTVIFIVAFMLPEVLCLLVIAGHVRPTALWEVLSITAIAFDILMIGTVAVMEPVFEAIHALKGRGQHPDWWLLKHGPYSKNLKNPEQDDDSSEG